MVQGTTSKRNMSYKMSRSLKQQNVPQQAKPSSVTNNNSRFRIAMPTSFKKQNPEASSKLWSQASNQIGLSNRLKTSLNSNQPIVESVNIDAAQYRQSQETAQSHRQQDGQPNRADEIVRRQKQIQYGVKLDAASLPAQQKKYHFLSRIDGNDTS